MQKLEPELVTLCDIRSENGKGFSKKQISKEVSR